MGERPDRSHPKHCYRSDVGIEQRRHPRYGVHLAVRYANAEQFVADYVENLSVGGLFIAGAHQLPLFTETDVQVELPGQGSWTVTAKSVFIIDENAARASGRKAGAGMEITKKPPGFDDALLGYLLRLGQRRDHSVMVGDIAGIRVITDAGYRVIGLESPEETASLLDDVLVKLVAVLLPPDEVDRYATCMGSRGTSMVIGVEHDTDMPDILARIDSLL
jgi:Tfp pilus assembly protein PilZ